MLFNFILFHMLHLVNDLASTCKSHYSHIISHLHFNSLNTYDFRSPLKANHLLAHISCFLLSCSSFSPPFLTFLPLLSSPLPFLSRSLCSVQSGFFLSPDNPPQYCFNTQTNTHTSYLPSPLIRHHEGSLSVASPLSLAPLPGNPVAIPPWDGSEVKARAGRNRQN